MGSTNGTSIRPLIEKIRNKEIDNVELACVISDRKNSGLLEYINRYEKGLYIPKTKEKTAEQYDLQLIDVLTYHQVEYIFLVGWMRLLTPEFIKVFKNRAINIHPSLLPAFAGKMDMDIHQSVLSRGCKITGATIMYIDEGPDTGPIIDQLSLRIPDGVTPLQLKERVQALETELMEKVMRSL